MEDWHSLCAKPNDVLYYSSNRTNVRAGHFYCWNFDNEVIRDIKFREAAISMVLLGNIPKISLLSGLCCNISSYEDTSMKIK